MTGWLLVGPTMWPVIISPDPKGTLIPGKPYTVLVRPPQPQHGLGAIDA